MIYIIAAILALLLSLIFYPLAKKLGQYFKILDQPSKRKVHRKIIPRTGGLVFFVIFWILIFGLTLIFKPSFLNPNLLGRLFVPAFIIFILGFWDDKISLSPYIRLGGQIVAALIAVFAGFRIEVIQIPTLGMINFPFWLQILITIFWIVLLINIINWLDGLNGLASGMGIIAFLAIVYTAFLPWVNAFSAALISSLMVGLLLGFLPFNFFKGSIFMGDSGSNFLGFMLAISSILGGSKLATAFLVLGLPILDGLWVIIQRLKNKKSIFLADKNHFHHRLLRLGLSEKQAVLFFWLIALAFGFLVLTASNKIKFFGLIILIFICLIFFALLDIIERKSSPN